MAVDVVAEMDVRVEDLGTLGQLGPDLLLVARDQLPGRAETPAPRHASVWGDARTGRMPRRMPDVLIFADSVRSPEMRHEVPVLVPDPFLYVEKDGKRHGVDGVRGRADRGSRHRGARLEEFGYDEMLEQGLPPPRSSGTTST